MKKQYQGSLTIEAAVIIPLLLFLFVTVITILFYYYDKNVTLGVAHEVVTIATREGNLTEEFLEQEFQKKIQKKTLLFQHFNVRALLEESEISITCTAKKSGMTLQAKAQMSFTEPESVLRKAWQLQQLNKGETDE